MACNAARLCERTAGRRVPALWPGGGLLRITPHCVVVTALGGCGAVRLCRTHTMLWVPTGAELARYGKRHTPLRQGRERAEHPSGWQRCGAGELSEPQFTPKGGNL